MQIICFQDVIAVVSIIINYDPSHIERMQLNE